MTSVVLKNKPLVEAIFELRWELQEQQPGIKIDPPYQLIIGGIYDKVKEEFPFHERLPTASMPDEIAGYVVQHRFRRAEGGWPLIQIGPGIITLNDTEGYVWNNFQRTISKTIEALLNTYPDSQNMRVNQVLLRYLDAINFDYENDDILAFLQGKMKMSIRVEPDLYEETGVDRLPRGLDLRFSFPAEKPNGEIKLRFTRGETKGQDSLIWETMVQSVGDDAPQSAEEIGVWAEEAHKLTHEWFFKTIDGELFERFK